MIFKSSTVALVISSVFAVSANANNAQTAINKLSVGKITNSTQESNTDVKSSFVTSQKNSGVYLIVLSEKSALDASYSKLGDNRSSVVAVIDKQQNTVLDFIRSIDGNSVLTRKARLTENVLYMQMTHEAAELAKVDTNIVSIELLSEDATYTSADEFKKFPFLEIKDPGDNVTVAIVGNGIDYTHKALGGAGTAEAYSQAWANRSNAWDGFPTDTVIGGLDFSAKGESGYHSIDYNPIEYAEDINVASGAIASGTAVAAKVLEQAPDAKILFYKTWDWDTSFFFPVLDVIVDPNQDGDISDRPDVIVLNAWGNGGFYVEDDTNGSGSTREVSLVRRLSAAGSLVVVGAGQTYYNSYFNLAWRGAVPEALTVGSVNIEGESVTLSEFTPAGPTRGTHQLKPEVVAPAEDIVGPIAGSGDATGEFEASSTYAAAYAAGTVAKILANYPQLSPLEAKALIANTAISDGIQGTSGFNEEFAKNITTVAEVPFMGTGLVNGDIAVTADAVVWETSSYQPALAYGFVEASSSAAVSRDVTIRNLTDEVQTYHLSTMTLGAKPNNAAISFIYPETINVPANHSVVFNVTMTVDASKLTEQGMTSTDDFTIENFTKENVNGYLVFNNANENSAQLKMSWQVFPKNAESLTKSNRTDVWGIPYEANDWSARASEAYADPSSELIDISNEGNSTKTIFTMPTMRRVTHIEDSKFGGQGHMLKNMGATISPEAMCESGSKLTVAVQMFDKWDLPMAEHFDKVGHLVTYFSIYTEEYVERMGGDPLAIDQDRYRTENDVLAYFEIAIDNDGKPQAEFIDYEQEYEWWNPRGRFVASSLGTDVAIGDDTLVAYACLDELFHDDIQSADAWDGDLGWQFATDRDARADIGEEMTRYNPTINGRAFAEIIDHTGEYNYPPYTYTFCDPNGTDWSGNPFPEDYCIEEANTFVGSHTGIAKVTEDENDMAWSNKVVLAPNETARLSVTAVDQCNPNLVRFEPFVPHESCPPGVMIFELGTDNTGYSDTNYGGDVGVKEGQGFSVYENTENGTVIGKLSTYATRFLTPNGYEGSIYLVNALPGTPFYVAEDGTITVANSSALDYEQTQSYTLKVHIDYVNRDTKIVEVEIHINNRNDVSPVMTTNIATISSTVGEAVEASISGAFSDAEGDGITFTSNDLPTGLLISRSGVISGTPETSGDFQASVTASDGMNTTSATLNISVAPASQVTTPVAAPVADTSSNSGGSTGILFMLFAGLALINRQARK